jgi:phage shock protein C
MYCAHCGKQMDAGALFCPACGATQQPVMVGRAPLPGQLTRSRQQRMVAGVCGGLSLHYGWDLSLVRIVCALMIILTGVGLIAYLVAWIVIPDEPYALPEQTGIGTSGPAV